MKSLRKINLTKVFEIALAVVIIMLPIRAAFAASGDILDNTAGGSPCTTLHGVACSSGNGDISSILITIINWALGLAGLISVGFIIYGGFKYIFSAGNEKTAGEGKAVVFNALIGLVIIILAYVIVRIVVSTVTNVGVTS